jgi:hypothetical protein
MKANSIHQSWVTLIALGEERFETRSWKPCHRGPIISSTLRPLQPGGTAPL